VFQVADVETIRAKWNQQWEDAHKEYVSEKDSQGVLAVLAERYRQLEVGDKAVVDGVVGDALLSDQEWRRYDALFLVKEFGIRSATESLKALAQRLAEDQRPGAPFEFAKVQRIVSSFSGAIVETI
jgi:hypothetical protein